MHNAQTMLDTLIHYVDQIDRLVAQVEQRSDCDTLLDLRAAPDVFPAGQQMAIALNFAARAVAPIAGCDLPAFPDAPTPQALHRLAADVRGVLQALSPKDLSAQNVTHTAGFAQLIQDSTDFVLRYALPNMIFHFTMAYAPLRAAGVPIGKSDFDGLHMYPNGFSFEQNP